MTTKNRSHTSTWVRGFAVLALLVFALSLLAPTNVSAGSVTTYTGTINGAIYLIQVPTPWNGTLLLYSHGYVTPGAANPALDVGDPLTGSFLLAQGFALAGSSYSTTGWAVEQAFNDQIALLDKFDQLVSHPKRTVAWGHSLGGIITAGLVQKFPDRFAGALPMCGVLAGGVGIWNEGLDAAFALKTLLAPNSGLQIVHITNPNLNLLRAEGTIVAAQRSAQGKARLALVSALADIPGWFTPGSTEPAPNDYASQEHNQFLWAQQEDLPFQFAFRAELEARAQGNPSWNTGVDYRNQLAQSVDRDEVIALYSQAGLDLNKDLATLNQSPRIAADPGATDYLVQNITFDGNLPIPVLTMHTTGDGLVPVENEQAYAQVVNAAGKGSLLRQVFVHRAGHCTMTPAESIVALYNLVQRLNTGTWGNLDATVLNGQAATLGQLNLLPPAFLNFTPARFLRPFDRRMESEDTEGLSIGRLNAQTRFSIPLHTRLANVLFEPSRRE